MANSVCEVLVTEDPLVAAPGKVDCESGAVVDFRGVVRGSENDREIKGIEYEAHVLMAQHQLQQVGDAAAANFKLRQVILWHRIGFVKIGEPSLFLRVKAPHRGAAFAASKWIVDELKKKVPIWKKPVYKIDGAGPAAGKSAHRDRRQLQ